MTNDNNPKPVLEKAYVEKEHEESLSIPLYVASGRKLDLAALDEKDIDLTDIAHSLSMQCRYGGHTNKFYSVAEHSVLLAEWVLGHPTHGKASYTTQLAKVMLLHDASEAYLGDVVYHLKQTMYEYCVFEEYVLEKIFNRFGIRQEALILEQLWKGIDRSVCIDEMEQLCTAGVDPELAEQGCQALGIKVRNWTPEEAKEQFLLMAESLELNKEPKNVA